MVRPLAFLELSYIRAFSRAFLYRFIHSVTSSSPRGFRSTPLPINIVDRKPLAGKDDIVMARPPTFIVHNEASRERSGFY